MIYLLFNKIMLGNMKGFIMPYRDIALGVLIIIIRIYKVIYILMSMLT